MPLFRTRLFETRRKTRQQKRIVAVDRTKLYTYCNPCAQWEQWSAVMSVKFSKDKNRRANFIVARRRAVFRH